MNAGIWAWIVVAVVLATMAGILVYRGSKDIKDKGREEERGEPRVFVFPLDPRTGAEAVLYWPAGYNQHGHWNRFMNQLTRMQSGIVVMQAPRERQEDDEDEQRERGFVPQPRRGVRR